MAERSFTKNYDPLRHYVNNMSDFDPDIFRASQSKDNERIKEHLAKGLKSDYDVFICVNKGYHAFVLCSAKPQDMDDTLWPNLISKDPFDIPDVSIVYQFELCYESEELQTYRIRKKFSLFKDMRDKIHKAYFIGNYTNVSIQAFQLAALRASPHRYNVMLEDCVEFSKEFCVQLLAYCNNWKAIESDVNSRIKEATATGLSAEQLSRRVRSSARAMNSLLGGVEWTSYLDNARGSLPLVIFVLLYPLIISLLVSLLIVYLMKS